MKTTMANLSILIELDRSTQVVLYPGTSAKAKGIEEHGKVRHSVMALELEGYAVC